MIRKIDSSLTNFKSIEFHAGLNVLLSRGDDVLGEGKTRNSAGKSSLIEIIHFLLGANCDGDSIFRNEQLKDHSFFGEFRFAGVDLQIERTGSKRNNVYVNSELANGNILPVRQEQSTGKHYLTNNDWKDYVGSLIFSIPQLPPEKSGIAFNKVSFRSLISYFIRRNSANGFWLPQLINDKQQLWDWQTSISYLFNLNWEIPIELRRLKDHEKRIKEVAKLSQSEDLSDMFESVASLSSKIAIAQRQFDSKSDQLKRFNVLKTYRELEQETKELNDDLQKLSLERTRLDETIKHLEENLISEQPTDSNDLNKMYEAAQFNFPEQVKKSLEEVEKFRESIERNRKYHLEHELKQARDSLNKNLIMAEQADKKRSRIASKLNGRGAMDDFVLLKSEVEAKQTELEHLNDQLERSQKIEKSGAEIKKNKMELYQRLQHDLTDRKEIHDDIINLVDNNISALYGQRERSFNIEATENGLKFNLEIQGDRGSGISNMEIFCFDLALYQFLAKKKSGPGFLIHDSHIFDGVDNRQVALALKAGSDAANTNNGQYIVTMNSDKFDQLPPVPGLDIDASVLGTILSDETPDKGLFGFQF